MVKSKTSAKKSIVSTEYQGLHGEGECKTRINVDSILMVLLLFGSMVSHFRIQKSAPNVPINGTAANAAAAKTANSKSNTYPNAPPEIIIDAILISDEDDGTSDDYML